MKQRTCSRKIPEGIRERMVFLPSTTRVCPALWPPWNRATAAARSMRRSTTLPLPSSPHWVPMTTTNLPTGCGSYRTRKRITTPTSMLPRPAIRNSRSPISSSFAKARFTPRGFRKGAMPSNTKNKPSAASRSVRFNDTTAPDRSLPQAALLGARMRLVGILQVLEELPVRRHDQQVAVLAERMVVRLQTAIEAIKLGILRISLRVDRGRLRITLTMHAQRVLLRVREDLGALPLGGRLDLHALTLALGAQPARDLREILLHALVHARAHLVGEVDRLYANVDEIDTETGDILLRLHKHLVRHSCTIGRHDLLESALSHDTLDAVLHDFRQPPAGDVLVTARRLEIVT